jgi:hypothetical protein
LKWLHLLQKISHSSAKSKKKSGKKKIFKCGKQTKLTKDNKEMGGKSSCGVEVSFSNNLSQILLFTNLLLPKLIYLH